MRETARSAHVWGKGWERRWRCRRRNRGKWPETELRRVRRTEPSGRVPVAILSWGKGMRDLLSGDRAEFGFPLAPAGSCAVFFQ